MTNAYQVYTGARQLLEGYAAAMQPLCRREGLAPNGVDILLFLANNPGLDTARDICETQLLKKSAVSRVAEGLVRRVAYLEEWIGRLESSLKAAGEHEKLVFLHYPPLYQGYRCPEILRLLKEYGVKLCCYGHLHGASHRRAIEGMWDGTEFSLVSADYLKFVPKKICE